MEVQVNKDFRIGVEWGAAAAPTTTRPAHYFPASAAPPRHPTRSSRYDLDPAGAARGLCPWRSAEGYRDWRRLLPNLGAVVNAYKNDADINVIATPQILTTDNKKATIKVGENVPYITSKNTTEAQQVYQL